MKPLNNIPKIVGISFDKLKNLSIKLLNKSQISLITINKKDKTLVINIDKLDAKTAPLLQKTIRDFVADDGLLLEEGARETLQDFQTIDNKKETQEILNFFKGRIPASDLEILRASLYLKSVYERGQPVAILKANIIDRHGDRGRNISNLCTAGYFTSHIRPLYEEMFSQPDFSPDKFSTVYEIIVTESPYAIFINSRMNNSDVRREVLQRMGVGKKYGFKYLNIHGIGMDNTEKIVRLLKNRTLSSRLKSPPEITRGERYIVVKLRF